MTLKKLLLAPVALLPLLVVPVVVGGQGRGIEPAQLYKPLADAWTSYSGDYTGRRYSALDKGRIDVAAGFTTDGQLTHKDRYVVLTDPKGIFGFQNIVPVVSRKVLATQGPAFAATLNAVSAKLTNEALQSMNAAVDLRKQKPAAVARAFLLRNGLLRAG